MQRRDFLSSTLALAASSLAPRPARAADGLVEVLIDEPIGEIAPEFHGHFTEHIGGVIYDGIWVGEDSKIPNVGGIRKAIVDHMQQLKAPVVRWPGGCFADSYNWRDGIGPRAQRPVRTNFWANVPSLWKAPDGPQKYEPNTYGTAEFMRFCQLCGSKPYLAGNVRSLTPTDFDQWVEYCNSPSGMTTLAKTRAADGSSEPYGVLYWGIGNESWGCGGDFQPQEYAVEFRRFTAWVPDYGAKLRFIASGPGAEINDPKVEWTRGLFEGLLAKGRSMLDRLYGLSVHYYCWTAGKGSSIDFTVDDWYQLLWQADVMDSIIEKQWLAMGEFDKEHKVKLVVDEWGAWHRGPAIDPRYLFSYPPSLRDGLVTGITLDAFNRHAEKLAMANVAQLVNNIHTLFLAREDRFAATPVFHVFDMYKAHQGGQSLRFVADAPSIGYGANKSLWGLAGSASLHGKTLVITVVNPHVTEERTVEVALRGAAAQSCRATVLTSSDIHAHNDFDHPNTLEPHEEPANVSGSSFTWAFKPASVTKLEIALT
ncbi:MAG TPA: alpha-L-arabinofuranosidase C-terminal domain-containing protein [Terriglobia bacterium]|nr:alpha-L-arabinofuranosidase C-terminal domain-containing protein [Terriglobia bacterium]